MSSETEKPPNASPVMTESVTLDDGDKPLQDVRIFRARAQAATDDDSNTESDSEGEDSSQPPIDIAAIDALIAALKMLKKNGGYVDDGLPWSPESEQLSRLEPNNSDIALVKATLKLVECVIPPLRKLVCSAESARSRLRRTFMTLSCQHSFHLLPNEVLAMIFEHAAMKDRNMPVRLASVSRRFRAISIRLPNLWTTLSSHKLLDDSHCRVARSRTKALKVQICAHQGQPVPQERAFSLFNFSLTLASRLCSLEFDIKLSTDGGFLIRFLSQYPVLQFPVLTSLSFACTSITNEPSVMLCRNAKPFLHWLLPSLREVRTRNFIPAFSPSVLSGITSFSISYGDRIPDGDHWQPPFAAFWNLGLAASFIGSLPSLEELSVEMVQARFQSLPMDFSLYLPKVTKLSILCDVHEIGYLSSFSNAIFAPVCKTFALGLTLQHRDMHLKWVLAAVKSADLRLPAVENFRLSVRKRHAPGGEVLINEIMQEFPKMRNLSLEGVDFAYTPSNDMLPPLRSIRLKNVENVEHTFFYELLENGCRPDDAGPFGLESVVFDGCKDVELDEIIELVSEKKVIWLE